MDVNAATAGLVGIIALGTVAAALAAFRWSEREQRTGAVSRAEPAEPVVPDGVADVLSVLRSSAVLLDTADAVVKASPAAYAFGIVRGDSVGHTEILAMARKTRRDGEIRQADLELPRGPLGRETLSVSVRVAPLSSRLVLVLVEDRTEARRIDAIRRDFVANVSHELKTPIGALSLLAEAVLDAREEPEAVERFATRMQYEASRLANLVQELLNLSRLQGDDPLAQAVPVAVDTVVADALDRSRAVAAAKEIDLDIGGTRGLYVLGDHAQLVMALGNLVENAVSYSPDATRVAVVCRENGGLVEIAVTDQGIGIPERDLDRIFERFYRVDPARSRATGGTGLGLSIVKHIAAGHGGDVTVWSQEGAGSTFTLRLPIAGPHTTVRNSARLGGSTAPRPISVRVTASAPAAGTADDDAGTKETADQQQGPAQGPRPTPQAAGHRPDPVADPAAHGKDTRVDDAGATGAHSREQPTGAEAPGLREATT